MGHIRYLVAIGFYLSIGSVGLMAAAFGAFCVLECLIDIVYTAVRQAGGPSTLRPVELLQFLGYWTLVGAIGAGLVRFAWIGAVRRVRLGLPDDNEGVGTSPGRRLLLGGLSAIVFVYGAGMMALGIMLSGPTAINVLTQPKTEAKVVRYNSLDAEARWLLTYRFDVYGRTYEGGHKLKADMRYSPDIKTLEVTYDPADPERHEVTSGYSIWEFAFFVVSRALLGLVGLWGLWRNAFPGRRAPDPIQVAPVVPAAPVGSRRVFGRRA